MNTTVAGAPKDEEDLHMGSEYVNARDFASRLPRTPLGQVRRRRNEPQHGSNDTDFGVPDQSAD